MENKFKQWVDDWSGALVLGLILSLLWAIWDYSNPVPWQFCATFLILTMVAGYIVFGDGNTNQD